MELTSLRWEEVVEAELEPVNSGPGEVVEEEVVAVKARHGEAFLFLFGVDCLCNGNWQRGDDGGVTSSKTVCCVSCDSCVSTCGG